MTHRKTYIKLTTQEQATRATTGGSLIRMIKAKKIKSEFLFWTNQSQTTGKTNMSVKIYMQILPHLVR